MDGVKEAVVPRPVKSLLDVKVDLERELVVVECCDCLLEEV